MRPSNTPQRAGLAASNTVSNAASNLAPLAARPLALALLASLSGLGFTSAASAQVAPVTFYTNNFESASLDARWGGNSRISFHSAFSNFNGRFSFSELATLNVDAPRVEPRTDGSVAYTLTFDLYVIDSWDGNDTTWGRDEIRVAVNSRELLRETIANQSTNQSFRAPDVGRFNFAYRESADSIYRDVAIPFSLPAGRSLSVVFSSSPLQGHHDESWGIDNVRLSYTPIPAPGLTTLAGLGALGLGARRRRRS
ncbi:MAG: hypothetical protein SFZ23_04160 [Planctomycetota bacterium]|nr:hypothetical protein [Planctomycetota bacterium]